jgi:hypothetical protein
LNGELAARYSGRCHADAITVLIGFPSQAGKSTEDVMKTIRCILSGTAAIMLAGAASSGPIGVRLSRKSI